MTKLKAGLLEMFEVDRSAVDLTKPTLGIAIILVALILLSTIGSFGFTLAFGAVLAILFDSPGPKRQRVARLVVFAALGACATLAGNASGRSETGSVVAVFVVTLVCGLGLALGPQAGKMAFFLNIWMMFTLSLSTVLHEPLNLASGFFAGAAILPLLLLVPKPSEMEESDGDADEGLHLSLAPVWAHLNLSSPILHFALSRAVVAGFAMWLGWELFPVHPYWIAMTLLIVVVPDRQQAARTSWQRAIGTAAGVVAGVAVLEIRASPVTLLLIWLLVTQVMLAVQEVNYVLYASVLTLNLVVFYQLLEQNALFNGVERLATTLIGIAFALGIIFVLGLLANRSDEPGSEMATEA